FLAPGRRGAHAAESLIAPTPEAVGTLLAAGDGILRQITLAPELPGARAAVRAFTEAGVVVAVGHTEADYAIAGAAFDHGARLLTHALNGMPGL
ncbi:N-acetylglucosamine-6-phosphate deacetylase, partial [Staphylococcus aureus]